MTDRSYVIEAHGPKGQGARYSTTGTPEGVVYFATREEACQARAQIVPEMPSGCLPLVVIEAESMPYITADEANAEIRAMIDERDEA